MNELGYIADEIRLKVARLLTELDGLRKRCDALEKENSILKNTLESQKNTLSELAEKNKIVKLAGSLSFSGNDVHELKQKVNAYIREIDECIRLLSDR